MPLNLAPDGFLGLPQGPRVDEPARQTLRKLLEKSITEGRFVSATKILAKDPSLITEMLGGEEGKPKRPAVALALSVRMDALVLFALAQGVNVDAPEFGAPRGLLEVGVDKCSPALVSFAFLYHADPNQTEVTVPGGVASGMQHYLDAAITSVCNNLGTKGSGQPPKLHDSLQVAHTLLDAGADPKLTRTVLPQLCKASWAGHEVELTKLFIEILKRGPECVDMTVAGMPLICLAAGAKNIDAVKTLIRAGASTDKETLRADLFKVIKDNGMGEHIPALTELIMRHQIARQASSEPLVPTVTIISGPAENVPRYTSADVL